MIDVLKEEIESNYHHFESMTDHFLAQEIRNHLMPSGIMFRVFNRVKSKDSLIKKLEKKYDKYAGDNRGLRDLYGIRIILYFADDIEICIRILEENYELVEKEHDCPEPEIFKPRRINYVFKIPDKEYVERSIMKKCMIDPTFEVQIRTIFSEGWHEIEHDLRYKYKSGWNETNGLSRELNGIFATLEVCDSSILNISDRLSYGNYKKGEWEAMIRNKFRLRFATNPLDNKIKKVLNSNNDIAKEIYRYDRGDLIKCFYSRRVPITYDNVIYIINCDRINNTEIALLTPEYVERRIRE